MKFSTILGKVLVVMFIILLFIAITLLGIIANKARKEEISFADATKMIFSHSDSEQQLRDQFDFPKDETEVPASDSWTNTSSKYIIGTYYSQWSIYERNHYPRDIPLKHVTNVFYSFMGINSDTGEIVHLDRYSDLEAISSFKVSSTDINDHTLTTQGTPQDTAAKLITTKGTIDQLVKIKKYHPNLKVSMSIGGAGTSDQFTKMTRSASKFKTFIESSITTMLLHGFDGIDIDWEFPQDKDEAGRLVEILRALRGELNKIEQSRDLRPGSLILSVAVPCSLPQIQTLNVEEMDKYLNFWNLMCYDFAGAWSSEVEYHSNLYSTRNDQLSAHDGVQGYISRGVNPRKLILGQPNYGRGFTKTDGYLQAFEGVGSGSSDETGIYNYNNLPLEGCEEEFDEDAVAAYCYDNKTRTWVSYDNARSAVVKAEYVKENNLGGGFWWESCGDNYRDASRSTLQNFVKALQKD